MSHTNSTANYGLPQFLGSDKPAWLGDINPALSKVDQQMKVNADGVASATLSANNAQNSADTAKSVADSAVNKINTVEETVNSQGQDINVINGKINKLNSQFNLNHIESKDVATEIPGLNPLVGKYGTLTLAQNDDGSIFKFYGTCYVENNTSTTYTAPKVSVPGLVNTYGIATGLFLRSAPTEAYTITPFGIKFYATYGLGYNTVTTPSFFVGTDAQIYISIDQDVTARNINQTANYGTRHFYMPNMYFNTNFGDTTE